MEVIDEGGFGCVIKPPLNCKNERRTKPNMVSKLQLTKYADYEMHQYTKLKKICRQIPNCSKYTILDAKSCIPVIPSKISNKTKCSLLEEKLVSSYVSNTKKKTLKTMKTKKAKNQFKIINLPFMGVNMHRYILQNADFKNPETFVFINNAIIDLYQNFIMLLNKKDFYHNDIKTSNILVNKDNRFRLIDWGISNKIVFTHNFVFNKPYMYILMSNYFLDKIEKLKKEGHLSYEPVKELILNYVELIKMKNASDYIYTKEILEFLFPNYTDTSSHINPVLLECLIQTSLRYESSKKWVDIYINNLDISSVAIIYPDILCAMAMKKQIGLKLQQGIISFYNKYIIECYHKINPAEFIDDLNKLNLLVV